MARITRNDAIEFLRKTYTGDGLKAQAGVQKRHAEGLDLSPREKKAMAPVLPTGKANTSGFKAKVAESLFEADKHYPRLSDEQVKTCRVRAELEVEARRRLVDLSKVGSALADVRKAILGRAPQEGDDNSEGEEEEVGETPRWAAKRAKGEKAPLWEAYEVTGIRAEDGSTEYEVWWRPCEANGWSKKEKTWEVPGCSLVKGGLDKHIRRYMKALHEGEERKAGRKRKASAGERKKEDSGDDIEEEGDEGGGEAGYEDEGEEEDREKRSKKRKAANEEGDEGEDPEGLCKQIAGLTAALAARQKGLEGQVEQMQKTTERMADLHEQHSSGAKGRAKKEKLATGEEAGVLGLLKTWEEKGEERFQKHIETQKWYKQDQVDSDREEVRRMNELIDRRERVERQMREMQERRDRKPDEGRLATLVESKAHQWIEVPEDLYMAYTVWKQLQKDPKVARHMWEVYNEAKYDTTEDRRALEVRKEAEKRAKKERVVLRDDAVASTVARRGEGESRKRRDAPQEERERPRKDGGSKRERDGGTGEREDRKRRNDTELELNRAEDMWSNPPGWLRGKYVTARKGERPFKKVSLKEVADKTYKRDESFGGRCMECGEAGHKGAECGLLKDEYSKKGKTVVTPLKLYNEGLLWKDGGVKDN